MLAKIVGCYIPCSINLYGCIGYVYCRNNLPVTFVLVWVGNRNIVIFTKFGFQNDGGVKLGAIFFKSMTNPLSNPAGNVAQRRVYQAILVEMPDKTLYGIRATQRHKEIRGIFNDGKYPRFTPTHH